MPIMPPRHRPIGAMTGEKYEASRPTAPERGYDVAWRKCRAAFLDRHRICSVEGCGARASEVDHIKTIKERPDLRLVWSNLRAMCKPCHSRRTFFDQGWGR